MKFYIAASYPRKLEAWTIARMLSQRGHKISSVWHLDVQNLVDNPDQWGSDCIRDLYGVQDCTHLVQLTGDTMSRGGRHTELGIALALGKKISLIGPNEQVFHRHASITHHATVQEFFDSLPVAKLF